VPDPGWLATDPVTETDERMALGQTRGTVRDPGPDGRDGTEDELGEP
jgi:hypothetical protein